MFLKNVVVKNCLLERLAHPKTLITPVSSYRSKCDIRKRELNHEASGKKPNNKNATHFQCHDP